MRTISFVSEIALSDTKFPDLLVVVSLPEFSLENPVTRLRCIVYEVNCSIAIIRNILFSWQEGVS